MPEVICNGIDKTETYLTPQKFSEEFSQSVMGTQMAAFRKGKQIVMNKGCCKSRRVITTGAAAPISCLKTENPIIYLFSGFFFSPFQKRAGINISLSPYSATSMVPPAAGGAAAEATSAADLVST